MMAKPSGTWAFAWVQLGFLFWATLAVSSPRITGAARGAGMAIGGPRPPVFAVEAEVRQARRESLFGRRLQGGHGSLLDRGQRFRGQGLDRRHRGLHHDRR